ncbi:putative membrane protein [Halovivax ruber XH-70]|uniref:Putative membrane protein n=1 Tax=Halovivax ruber (strain DSM 18193 / JCM 13892 / XH-70) TaxID=797302 RepID=L0IBW5_HALRX|nr:DUF63 family protein [Halovivax ruber]AGB15442.1 putative membrane protein [Halovivax ruber XH-70]
MVLPEGFAIPPWYFTVVLLLGVAGVGALLWAIDPPVTDRTVLAFTPWMMFGSTLYVLGRDPISAFPEPIAPLFEAPSVYVTTAILAGFIWIVANILHAGGLYRSIPRFVGICGTAFLSVFATAAIMTGIESGTFAPFWPVVAVVITGIVTAIGWLALSLWATEVAAITGLTGALVCFAQVLDGTSTAIGYDVLGAGEQVPLSTAVLELAGSLPTAEYIGAGWLFVLVKLTLALVVVWLFADLVRDRPRAGRIALGFVAAVGLGPGVHNLLLFTISG